MKRLLILFVALVITLNMMAQELMCSVNINSQRIEGVDKSVFDAMQTSMFEFVNNRKWTSFNYKMNERIECAILFTVKEVTNGDDFTGTLNIVLQRPVYKTDYLSPIINMVDRS